ncbi:MAG TPA: hypothetical protein VHJ78_00010 [Actinomycetota bacterium]|nr:hypothetical protein [Actinomycetota bacterium]
MAPVVNPNDYDRFFLRQRFRMVTNEYDFHLVGPDGAPEPQPFCFVRQKTFKFREDIRFYVDASRSEELLRIKARQRFDPRARYDVTDSAGGTIGSIQKVFGASLLRSTYKLYDPGGGEVATVMEESQAMALVRRAVGFVPYLDEVANWLPIPYHFVFMRDGAVVGTHRRQLFKLRDAYEIDMTADRDRTVDRRLVLAIAVGMDALQAR